MKDKEQTKRKLIQAVGEIIKSKGYIGLGVNKIAKKAGVDKTLIYRYFGGVNYLIEAYVIEKDYWMTLSEEVKEMIEKNKGLSSQVLITEILQNQFKFFFSEQEMQDLIILEISTESSLMQSIHNVREGMGRQLLELTDNQFNNTNVNFRAISALLVGGIYYSVLHTRFNGDMICDININSIEGRNEIIRAIQQIVSWAYQEAENNSATIT
ncbi:TetR/AcrR family transcriptional regulator [Mucilaginibacter sp. L196]|uniref:TetR/AcrR family transcriptional regulator n=1 Tax=Mucilaginibacter sp. L196 TaxID=1641870 RepID=UPI00131CA69C|nr:TetR/AcrR family transcriptional regulator [Mucilaginibacter sp. L196]